MPRASRKKDTIDPATTYVCWHAGSALLESGEEVTFTYGQRLRGDSRLVQAAPGSSSAMATRCRPTGTRDRRDARGRDPAARL
jgi:hypothetical protein